MNQFMRAGFFVFILAAVFKSSKFLHLLLCMVVAYVTQFMQPQQSTNRHDNNHRSATSKDLLASINERYAVLLDLSSLGVTISDCYEVLYSVNDTFLEMLGYTRAEFDRGEVTWSRVTPPAYDALDEEKLHELYATSITRTYEKEYIHKNGKHIPVVVSTEMLSYDPPINLSFVHNLTQQKQQTTDTTKSSLVAMLGHELKTPLSVLRLQGEMLAREIRQSGGSKAVMDELRDFDEQIAHIDHVLTNVLLFSQHKELHPVQYTELDVAACLTRVIADISLLTDRKICLGVMQENCTITGDAHELRELFTNLISNALKYSGRETVVEVSAWRQGREVVTEVRDWGRGIAPADQEKMFTPSYQVGSASIEHRDTSEGIGLHLCKKIVQRHRGRMEVISEVGKGSSFFCIFNAVTPS